MRQALYSIGIDEAGRGPLAGPVAVGAVLLLSDFNWELLPGVGDSKKVTPRRRELIFGAAQKLQTEGLLEYVVIMKTAQEIDSKGIVPCIKAALTEALEHLEQVFSREKNLSVRPLSKLAVVKLDGGLKAPAHYLNQETIIKGDAKELVIGLASIMAKVTRDHYMEKQSRKAAFAPYQFDVHKGYGTKIHRQLIKQHGLSKEHRASFCRNIFKV